MVGIQEVLCAATLCSCMLLTQSALGQALVPLPYIARTFGLENDPNQQSWFISAYSLTVGTFVLPSGRLGDMYGHRRMLQIGFAWFSIWEMVSGLVGQYTTSYVGYDITRALIGIGPAILLPNAVAILARLYPPGSLKKYITFSAFAATAPNGFVLGAVFSSLMADTIGWYWSCYIFSIVLALLFVISFLVIPSDKEIATIVERDQGGGTPLLTTKRQFDFWGTGLGVSGLILFNFAFNQAIVVGWSTVYVYVLLIIGVLLLAAFVIAEGRVEDPLVPLNVFTLRGSLILASVALGWSSFGTFTFYTVQFIQQLRHHSVLSSAAQFSPVAVAGICAAFGSAFFLSRFHPALVMLLSMTAFCAGNALIAFQPINQTYWIQTFIATIITPFVMDMSFPSASIIISDSLSPQQQGTAGSLVNTVVNYSIAFGLGLAGTVEMQVNRNGTDIERGYRGALYLGIGFAGLAMAFALLDLILEYHVARRQPSKEDSEKSISTTEAAMQELKSLG